MAYALYKHHFNACWEGNVKSYPSFLLSVGVPDARELNAPVERMAELTEQLMADAPQYGENAEVFTYQVVEGQNATRFVMRLRFYQGSCVTLLFQDLESPSPQHTVLRTESA